VEVVTLGGAVHHHYYAVRLARVKIRSMMAMTKKI
jgi:hypothetical protein